MKFSIALCILLLCPVLAHAQQTATTADGKTVILNKNGTWKYAEKSSEGVTLKIEAGIVYKQGGPEPVARTTFALLDLDIHVELKEMPATEGRAKLTDNALTELVITCGSQMPDAMAAIQKRTRYTLTTGFDGKAELRNIEPGVYMLFGATHTRGGCAVWLIPVTLRTNQSLTLDQYNAISAR